MNKTNTTDVRYRVVYRNQNKELVNVKIEGLGGGLNQFYKCDEDESFPNIYQAKRVFDLFCKCLDSEYGSYTDNQDNTTFLSDEIRNDVVVASFILEDIITTIKETKVLS